MTLSKTLEHLKNIINDILVLEAYSSRNLHWHIDDTFSMHYNMKIYAGCIFTLGKLSTRVSSTKQKPNYRSLIEPELVGACRKIVRLTWSKVFIEQ